MTDTFSNPNAYVTTVLCSKLALNNSVPLSYDEWSELYSKLKANKLDTADLLQLSENSILENLKIDFLTSKRLRTLFDSKRLVLLSDMMFRLERSAIYSATVYDCRYPDKLAELLNEEAPPILYYAGNTELLNEKMIAIACTHKVDKQVYGFADKLIIEICRNKYVAVFCGTFGAEQYTCDSILKNNGKAVIWVCDNMLSQYRNEIILKAIEDGRLLILSNAIPTAFYNSENAFMRNKCLYSLCEKVITLKAEYKHGGTWAGILNAINMNYAPVYCYDNINYVGNLELIKLGANAINEDSVSKVLGN